MFQDSITQQNGDHSKCTIYQGGSCLIDKFVPKTLPVSIDNKTMYTVKSVSDFTETVDTIQSQRSASPLHDEVGRTFAPRSVVHIVDCLPSDDLPDKIKSQSTARTVSTTTGDGELRAIKSEDRSSSTARSPQSIYNRTTEHGTSRTNKSSLKSCRESSGNVRVLIRARPLKTTAAAKSSPWRIYEDRGVIELRVPSRQPMTRAQSSLSCARSHQDPVSADGIKSYFTFDTVLGEGAQQRDVMDRVGGVTIDRVMEGYNGTVLCYGQSGSGKTHTMLGTRGGYPSARQGSEDAGLLLRMLTELLERLQAKFVDMTSTLSGTRSNLVADDADVLQEKPEWRWQMHVTAVELYREELFDLMIDTKDDSSIPMNQPSLNSTFHTVSPALTRSNSELTAVAGVPAPFVPQETTPNLGLTQRSEKSPNIVRHSLPIGRHYGSEQWTMSMPLASNPVPLKICVDPEWGVVVKGLSRHPVRSLDEAMHAVKIAVNQRHVSSTAMNSKSSRSHALFFISLEQWTSEASVEEGESSISSGRTRSLLTLVDLAGSERVATTGAEGLRLKEAQRINLSLTLLGNVIRRLAAPRHGESVSARSQTHVPYRDSKLTRILQESIGGNAHTTLLCNISLDNADLHESLSTIRFAQIAKQIRNRPVVNRVVTTAELKKQLNEAYLHIAYLEEKLAEQQARVQPSCTKSFSPTNAFYHNDRMGDGGSRTLGTSEEDHYTPISETPYVCSPPTPRQNEIKAFAHQDRRNTLPLRVETITATDKVNEFLQTPPSFLLDIHLGNEERQVFMQKLDVENARRRHFEGIDAPCPHELRQTMPHLFKGTEGTSPRLLVPGISSKSMVIPLDNRNKYLNGERQTISGADSSLFFDVRHAVEEDFLRGSVDNAEVFGAHSEYVTRDGWITSGTRTPRARWSFHVILKLLVRAVRPFWIRKQQDVHLAHTHLDSAQVGMDERGRRGEGPSSLFGRGSHSVSSRSSCLRTRASLGDPSEVVAMMILYGFEDIV